MGPGWTIPGVELESLLAAGTAYDAFRATRTADGAALVVKVLHGCDGPTLARLRRVAAVVGSLPEGSRSHLVAIHDVRLMSADDVVVVTELAPGGSLADVLERRGRLAPPEVVTLVAPLAEALAGLHSRGLAHGAVHARNVVFAEDGRPMLADAGIDSVRSGRAASPADDVRALARLGRHALGDAREAAGTLPTLLEHVATGVQSPDATELADEVLGSGPAAPIGVARAAAVASGTPRRQTIPRPRKSGQPTPASSVAPERARRRVLTALVTAAMVGLAVALGTVWGHHGVAAPTALVPGPRPPAASWTDIVTRLEWLRTRAYVAGDPSLLRAVYLPSSREGARDLATLTALTVRGYHARGLSAYVRTVEPIDVRTTEVRLRVVDALSRYDVVDAANQLVGSGAARTARALTMTLVRWEGGWRVASVAAA